MAKWKVDGLDVYSEQLKKLAVDAEKINRGALGEGAGVVADAMSDAIDSIPVYDESSYDHKHKRVGVTEEEKQQIASNFGISKFRNMQTSIGFHGMVDSHSGNSVATGELVQAVEYGTQFRKPCHCISPAIRSAKDNVTATMQKYIDDAVDKIMK